MSSTTGLGDADRAIAAWEMHFGRSHSDLAPRALLYGIARQLAKYGLGPDARLGILLAGMDAAYRGDGSTWWPGTPTTRPPITSAVAPAASGEE